MPFEHQRCEHRSGDPLSGAELAHLLSLLPHWQIDAGGQLARRFEFPNYHHTIAFVNAVARIAHEQDHHPDLQVGYSRCTVAWSTHSVGGLSMNDFICAAKVDALNP